MLQSPALEHLSAETRAKWVQYSHSRLLLTLCAADHAHEAIDILLALQPVDVGPVTYTQVLQSLTHRNGTLMDVWCGAMTCMGCYDTHAVAHGPLIAISTIMIMLISMHH